MSKSLRDFIKSNRTSLDEREPSEKVWNGIEASLPAMKHRSLWNSVAVWRVAALILMCLSVYLFVSRPSSGNPKKLSDSDTQSDHQSVDLQKEFSSLESFYRAEIDNKVAMISNYENADDLDHFTQDFQKLDAMYLVLKEEMKMKPSQKVKDALILNMLIRIDLLNQQLHRLDSEGKDSVASKNV